MEIVEGLLAFNVLLRSLPFFHRCAILKCNLMWPSIESVLPHRGPYTLVLLVREGAVVNSTVGDG